MLTEFPQFRPLTVDDRSDVERLTERFPPYSNFQFASLYAWDIAETSRVSTLHGNLAVRLVDPLSGEPFYSFLGDHEVDASAADLLRLGESEGAPAGLRLVPETAACRASSDAFCMQPEADWFDHLLSIEPLSARGRDELRAVARRPPRPRGDALAVHFPDLGSVPTHTRYLNAFDAWSRQRGGGPAAEVELVALHRLLFIYGSVPALFTVSVAVDGELCGFCIGEILRNGYALVHFLCADARRAGARERLLKETATLVGSRGCVWLSWEQGLGVLGGRLGRSGPSPEAYLRKYALRPVAEARDEPARDTLNELVSSVDQARVDGRCVPAADPVEGAWPLQA